MRAAGGLTRGSTCHGPASARRPSRLVRIKTRRRRAACIARLTCRQAVRRVGFGTQALAAQVNLLTVRPAPISQPHVSPAQPATHTTFSSNREGEGGQRRPPHGGIFNCWPGACCVFRCPRKPIAHRITFVVNPAAEVDVGGARSLHRSFPRPNPL